MTQFCNGGCFPGEPLPPPTFWRRVCGRIRGWYWRLRYKLFGPRIKFKRICVPHFTDEVNEQKAWAYDLRKVFSESSIKDLLANDEELT